MAAETSSKIFSFSTDGHFNRLAAWSGMVLIGSGQTDKRRNGCFEEEKKRKRKREGGPPERSLEGLWLAAVVVGWRKCRLWLRSVK